jgi:hypothetical protein
MFTRSFTSKIVPSDGLWIPSVFSFMSTFESRRKTFEIVINILKSRNNIDHLLRASSLVINISCNLNKDALCEMVDMFVFPLVISVLREDSSLDKKLVDRLRVICWLSVVFAAQNSDQSLFRILVPQGIVWVLLCMFDEDLPDRKECLSFNLIAFVAIRNLLTTVVDKELKRIILLEIHSADGFKRMFVLVLSPDEETSKFAKEIKLLCTEQWTEYFKTPMY